MRLERELITEIRGEWVLTFTVFGYLMRWPVFKTIQGVLAFIFLALAYNIGNSDAQGYIKWTAYFSQNNTIYDYQACQALTYYPTLNGQTVEWKIHTENITLCQGTGKRLLIPT